MLIDVDALAQAEGTPWVWHGAQLLYPSYDRALVTLSNGGSDSDVTREFDLATKRFIPAAEGGFVRPDAKGEQGWIDRDTLWLSTDFGEGTTSASGYAVQARLWRRGQSVEEAELVFQANPATDMAAGASHDHTPGFERDFFYQLIDFYTSRSYVSFDGGKTRTHIEVPDDANVGVHRRWMLLTLRTPWELPARTYPAGAVMAIDFQEFLAGSRDFTVIFEPTPNEAFQGAAWTKSYLVLYTMRDVVTRLTLWVPPDAPDATSPEWASLPLEAGAFRNFETMSVAPYQPLENDRVWLQISGFLTPPTLALGELCARGWAAEPEPIRALPAQFDASGLSVTQRFATSADGTRIPYFLIGPDATDPAPAARPTILYGYGGFQNSLSPYYLAVQGKTWLERGGNWAIANIRGGGEYGPDWHMAALKENRHRAYEDFVAVARDLVTQGNTSVPQLAAMGGSNGGLLVGNMLVTYPEDFGAIICSVPLLDMRRYHRYLAGNSWIAEYGDPDDPAQWEFMKTFSPYQLFDPARTYPPVLFTTSTRDDRVHPLHARTMAYQMLAAGKDVTYYENTQGGHGGAATTRQRAHLVALEYEFAWQRLGK